jgi:ABC-type sugar transport system ATPase subunit
MNGREVSQEDTSFGMSNIHKWFGALHVLRGIDFEILSGETVGLVGDNGAGKSTLLKLLSGVHQPTEGVIFVDGEPVVFENPAKSRGMGIETVYQDLALVSKFTIAENFFLGREMRTGPFLRRYAMRREADQALANLNIKVPQSSRTVAKMSGGQRQAVAIARGAYWSKRIVLLDEPTAALGVRESSDVLKLIESLRNKGLATLLVTHNFDHLWKVCTRVLVLRQGVLVANVNLEKITPGDVVALITGAADFHTGEIVARKKENSSDYRLNEKRIINE